MSKVKKSKPTKATKGAGLSLINLKVTSADRKVLMAQAEKYMKGNLSAWLRYSGAKFKPVKTPRPAPVR